MELITIKAFFATDDKRRSERFLEEHGRVLKDIGVDPFLPKDTSWLERDSTILIVAEHPRLGMVGGCRLQFAEELDQLPFYAYLAPIEPNLYSKVVDRSIGSFGELCGLWVAHRFHGRGLPWLLTSAAISVSTQTPASSFFCLSAEYSQEYARRNGFQPVEAIGVKGGVPFPIPTITSYLLLNTDPVGLRSALDRERYKQFSLRLTPDQRRVEQPKDEPIEVQYLLKLPQRVIPIATELVNGGFAKRRSA
jgi:hypothetical protein